MNDLNKQDENEIEHELQEWLSKAHRVVIAGIGNSLRRDDFVGVKIVRALQDAAAPSVCLIECETVPESFIEPITRFSPSHVLIIDAALLNLQPGSSRLLRSKQLMKQHVVSSHALPLRIFCEYLEMATSAKIALLLIQPGDTSFGEGLTKEVESTAERMAKVLSRFLHI